MFKRLKEKWGIESNVQILIICIVFSLTGFTIIYAKDIIWHIFGYTAETSGWLKFFTWLIVIFPLYYVFLVIYGTLFGQRKFFWGRVVKMLRRMSGKRNAAPAKEESDSSAELNT